MEIGVGLDHGLGLSFEEETTMAREAAQLGYKSIWTNEGSGIDSMLLCAHRWRATTDVIPDGLTTGIAVSPAGVRTAMGFAMEAGTLSRMSGGRFILGIGTGGAYNPDYRKTWNLQGKSSLRMLTDYLTTIRALVRGETVDYDGQSVKLHGVKLGITPPPETPVYLGALGPEMCRLGGELADGLSLNWCSAEQVALSRELAAEGSARVNRDPSEVKISEYIRICVDDDVDVARRAYTRAIMGYALGPLDRPAASYRAHFERMGFTEDLAHIDTLRRKEAPQDEVVDAFPEDLLKAVGYYGPADGAAPAFRALAEGLDTAIVRVVAARPGLTSIRAVMDACRPMLVPA